VVVEKDKLMDEIKVVKSDARMVALLELGKAGYLDCE